MSVVIHQQDNIHCYVECDDSTAMELSQFFEFTVPGAQFSPQYRKKFWDGKVRLFSTKTKRIYAGLVPYIIEFCNARSYSFENKTNYFDSKQKLAPDFISNLKLPLEPRDYQLNGFALAIIKKRVVIVSPTASGKSLMIYMIIRQLQNAGKKQGLLVVPTISLVEQMYADFKSYGYDVENNIQRIYQGKEKVPSYPLIISTWQSIYDMPKKYFSQFDYVIGDEAHTFKAKSLTSIMTNLINCDFRIGTTGTLDGTKVNKLVLEGLFGPSKKIVTTKELMDKKQLAEFSIQCNILKYSKEECKIVSNMTYQEEIEFLVQHERRNKYIRDLAISLHGNSLILFTFVEKHGKILHDLISSVTKNSNRKVFFVYGGTEVGDREAVRYITEKENDAIIIASYGTFSTGINIRNLHNIVFSSPTKSRIRSLQSIGRGLRLGDNKEKAILYDIVDDLRLGEQSNFAIKHFEERFKIYNEEKFNINVSKIDL